MTTPSDEHRPWPVPRSPWAIFMSWRHLAFLHWPLAPERLRPHVPAELELETHDGDAWIGITPFLMSGVRARFTPALPGLSSFPELNVRTYVSAEGRPGVWFMSLDADNRLAVRAARWFYHLPYRSASMSIELEEDERVEYRSARVEEEGGPARFHARYRPTGPERRAEAGSLEHWLTERYCLYSRSARRLYRAEIHHAPWPLRPGESDVRVNTMAEPLGIELSHEPPLVHVADRLDVVGWLPQPVG